jgi:hypothetical protein
MDVMSQFHCPDEGDSLNSVSYSSPKLIAGAKELLRSCETHGPKESCYRPELYLKKK